MKKLLCILFLSILSISLWADDIKTDQNLTIPTVKIDCHYDSSQYANIITSIKSLKSDENNIYQIILSLMKYIIPFLLGICAVPLTKRLFDTASIRLTFKNDDNECVRKFYDNEGIITDIDYRLQVFNKANKIIARKCSLRITILDIKADDVKECKKSYIKNKNQFSQITDEYILWDFNFENKHPYSLDILPQSHDMAAFAKFRKRDNSSYWEIPSENGDIPKIKLVNKKLKLLITVYGENIKLVKTKIIELEMPE